MRKNRSLRKRQSKVSRSPRVEFLEDRHLLAITLDSVAAVDENGFATLNGTVTDPGELENFTLEIDWGDSLSPSNIEPHDLAASLTGSQTFSLTHQYLDDNPTRTSRDHYPIQATVANGELGYSLEAPGNTFRVSTTTFPAYPEGPTVAMSANDGYVVTWASSVGDRNVKYDVFGQLYDSDGNPVGGEFKVNTNSTGFQYRSSAAMNAAGHFVVTWSGDVQDVGDFDVYGQRYNREGVALGSEFQVNTNTASFQGLSSVAINEAGNFVLTWVSVNQDGSQGGIYAQRYSNDGNAVGSEFQVNTHTQGNQNVPVIGMDSDGNFVVIWMSEDGLYGQRYNSEGVAVDGEFPITTNRSPMLPSMAMHSDGNFVVTWAVPRDRNQFDVYAQRYSSDGNAVGNRFRVNTYLTYTQSIPTIGMDSDGNFTIAWAREDPIDGDSNGIYGQRYHSDGSKLGREFLISSRRDPDIRDWDDKQWPHMAMNRAGDFVVAWERKQWDGRGSDLYAQRYVRTSDETTVSVNNVAPTFNAGAGESLAPATRAFSRTITFTDPGILDSHSATVDFGDGSEPQTISIPLGDRTFNVSHMFELPGVYTVVVMVEDDDLGSTTQSFEVTVNTGNDAPTLDEIPDVTINEDAGQQIVIFTDATAGGSETQPLRITASSSNTDLIPTPTVNYTTPNKTGSVAFTPVANQHGTATITVTVEDAGLDGDLNTTGDNATFSRSFDIKVEAENLIPGDSNRDGFFDSTDLVVVFVAGEYEDGIPENSTWETGDWNGDREFDTSDLVWAFVHGDYEVGPQVRSKLTANHRAVDDALVNLEESTDQWNLRALDRTLIAASQDASLDRSTDERGDGVELGRSIPGDSNRDGRFDSSDLVMVFRAGQYEDGVQRNSSWESGDWNGDREFDSRDLIFAAEQMNQADLDHALSDWEFKD